MNRKGITTVELLICFIIVMIITISMYSVVSAYNERRILESYKEQITTYKNTLTKDIQDDLIKVGLTGATYERTVVNSKEGVPVKAVYTIDLDLRDGTQRRLIVEQTTTKSMYHAAGYQAPSGSPNVDDAYMIKYGEPTPDASGNYPNMIEYALPNLGSYKSEATGTTALDFSINNVLINIYDEKVLSIYIGFYHPEFGTRYFIDITALIDFTFTGAEFIDTSRIAYFIIYEIGEGRWAQGNNPNLVSYDQTRLDYTLINPVRDGYTFTGWTGSNGDTPTTPLTLTRGTTGNKTFRANYRINKAYIRYTLDGETIQTPYTDADGATRYYVVDNHYIYTTNSTGGNKKLEQTAAEYGKTLPDYGFYNYDGAGNARYKVTLRGYTPVSGGEWACNCTAGASGCPCARQTYSWNTVYTAAQVCNATVADCIISVHPNWNRVDYTLTYNYASGSLPRGVTNPDKYNIDTSTFTINNPERTGYNFAGWTGTGLSSATTTVTIPKGSVGNRSYTATWSAASYPITYYYNSVSLPIVQLNPSSYTIETNTFTLKNPTRTHYDFAGWTGSNGTTAQTSVQVTKGSTGAKEYSANWNYHGYTITYDLDGGALASGQSNPTTYTINTESFTLKNPSKTGYTFTGWTGTGLSSASTSVTISKGSSGNRSYKATWSKNKYKINYNNNGGTGSITPTECYYNETCTLAATNLVQKNGYTSTGWYTTATGGSKYGSTTVLTSDITVYAHWVPNSSSYYYTGGMQYYDVVDPGTYKLEVCGAQGRNGGGTGGKGGCATGNKTLTAGTRLYIYVGGQDGYNGGGTPKHGGGVGGGATHIATVDRGILKNYSSHKTEVLIVGGGGGGGCNEEGPLVGGTGGGTNGGNGQGNDYGRGGSQTAGGHVDGIAGSSTGGFGYGGDAPEWYAENIGGGGAGWYGGSGGAGTGSNGSGGGGSGYTGGVTGGSMTNGSKSGNGSAKISYVDS